MGSDSLQSVPSLTIVFCDCDSPIVREGHMCFVVIPSVSCITVRFGGGYNIHLILRLTEYGRVYA